MDLPDELRYARTHEWVRIDGDNAVVGITDYAQDALGDITFVDPPTVGDRVEQGAECAVVESVKAASDVYAPLTGVVAEVNDALANAPERVNHSPYGEGWLFRIEKIDADGIEDLLTAAEYEATLGDP